MLTNLLTSKKVLRNFYASNYAAAVELRLRLGTRATGSDCKQLIHQDSFVFEVDPHVDGADDIRRVFGYMDMNDTETYLDQLRGH